MSDGGWRSQSLALKLMLAVSLVLVALGVYRCSVELTPPSEPGSIVVERASVDVPADVSTLPPDSLSSLTTRFFARGLRKAGVGEVSVGEDPAASVVVKLRLRATDDGRVELGGVARSVLSGRPLWAAADTDSLYRLRELAYGTSAELAREVRAARSDSASRGASRPEGR